MTRSHITIPNTRSVQPLHEGERAIVTPRTDYQAKYFAHELTRQAPSDSMERLAAAVAGAQVDLNPHQVDAALFAGKSPLSRGALLADEVGLGKTIEAGLVLSQHWAERRRHLLVICPASLRKQWQEELHDKFFLPSRIIEKKSFDAAIGEARFNPFDDDASIAICSFEYAARRDAYIRQVGWDLVVIDEAHRLRNVWKTDNKTARTIRSAIQPAHKLLLTATPLQNSLLELYGLVSIIDDHVFGDLESFRERYVRAPSGTALPLLRQRLEPIATRTLRRQVAGYVSFTRRRSMVEPFTPDDQEDTLYAMVSEYLRRPNLQALPRSQSKLITMTLRKLLASSTFAIAGALNTMSERLKRELHEESVARGLVEELAEDIETLVTESDELAEDAAEPAARPPRDLDALRAEIRELEAFRELALGIETNAKGEALLKVLGVAMDRVADTKAPRKAVIFTESRRTQDYLQRILADTEWGDGIVLFNGQNGDPRSREILKGWLAANRGTDRISESPAANMRAALVDAFRHDGKILIATEAAAEGINLQFCSLVINYDLPWNPQRIEQRIGRCHRYGQRHDVVVVNFLNTKNEADQRVFELLNEKFRLFDGVFGASDDPLGNIGSGVDIERRIFDLYQNCRDPEQIRAEYEQLRIELAPQIDAQMAITNQKLLEHFDDEVREKLRMAERDSKHALGRIEMLLMLLTRHELRGHARFTDDGFELLTDGALGIDAPPGIYALPRRREGAHVYRPNHPLAEAVVARAKERDLPFAEVRFTMTGRVSALAAHLGSGGVLAVDLLRVSALGQTEEYLLLSAVTDEGEEIDEDLVARMLRFDAEARPALPAEDLTTLDTIARRRQADIQQRVSVRNLTYFQEESEKLEGWSDDLKTGLEREIRELDRELREARKLAKAGLTLEEKLDGQKRVKALERERKVKRQTLFDSQDEIDARRDDIIAEIEAQLEQEKSLDRLFTIRWRLTA